MKCQQVKLGQISQVSGHWLPHFDVKTYSNMILYDLVGLGWEATIFIHSHGPPMLRTPSECEACSLPAVKLPWRHWRSTERPGHGRHRRPQGNQHWVAEKGYKVSQLPILKRLENHNMGGQSHIKLYNVTNQLFATATSRQIDANCK